MRDNYDFSNGIKNPYVEKAKGQSNNNSDGEVISNSAGCEKNSYREEMIIPLIQQHFGNCTEKQQIENEE